MIIPSRSEHRESGRLAQLGERRVRNAEAGGSIPPPSTNQISNLAMTGRSAKTLVSTIQLQV